MSARVLRTAIAASLALSLAGAGGALAGPKTACNLITDPAGDTTGPTTALDIVSGDVASNAKTFTAVIRTAALAESDLSSPTGIAWGIRFVSPRSELPLYVLATKFRSGPAEFSYGEIDGSRLMQLGTGKGVIDVENKEVRIHVPAKGLGLKQGVKVTDLTAQGRRATGDPNAATLYTNADTTDAASAKPYTVGNPSCVKPGA